MRNMCFWLWYMSLLIQKQGIYGSKSIILLMVDWYKTNNKIIISNLTAFRVCPSNKLIQINNHGTSMLISLMIHKQDIGTKQQHKLSE